MSTIPLKYIISAQVGKIYSSSQFVNNITVVLSSTVCVV